MNEYEKQAQEFLESTGTTLEIVYQYTGPHFAGEEEKRDVYRFTLRNKKGEYSSTFGDSLRDTAINRICKDRYNMSVQDAKDAGIYRRGWSVQEMYSAAKKLKPVKPSAYDILACLEKYDVGSFKDFCDNYGYNDLPLSDYPRVMGIYQAVSDQVRGLRRIFSAEEMDQLAEIR